MIPTIAPLLFEHFACIDAEAEIALILFIDSRQRILGTWTAKGSRDTVELPTAAILETSRSLGAHQLLMFHTHPSGDPRPSGHDMTLTRRLCAGLRRQRQRLLDHVILTSNEAFSFRKNGLL
ncbi:MAG: JAB domain-containing protein [Sphingobium sp.]